nr:MAG TPA: hypothetical protein [Caudoviricetes sp.]
MAISCAKLTSDRITIAYLNRPSTPYFHELGRKPKTE